MCKGLAEYRLTPDTSSTIWPVRHNKAKVKDENQCWYLLNKRASHDKFCVIKISENIILAMVFHKAKNSSEAKYSFEIRIP